MTFIVGEHYWDRRGRYTYIGNRTIRYDETGSEQPIYNLEIKESIHRSIVYAQEHPEFALTPRERRAQKKAQAVREMDTPDVFLDPLDRNDEVPDVFAALEEESDPMEHAVEEDESEEVWNDSGDSEESVTADL